MPASRHHAPRRFATLWTVRRRVFLLASMLVAGLLLSGCLRYTADLTIGADDTISGSLVIAKKTQTGDEPTPTGAAYQLAVPEPQSSSRAITVEPYEHQGDVGYIVMFDHATFPEVAAFTPVSGRGGTLTISRDEGQVKISMSIDLTYADNSANEQLTKDFEGTIAIHVPGEVVQTNGEVDDDMIVWTLKPLAVNSISATVEYDKGEADPVNAEDATSSGFPWWAWAIAGAVVLGVVVLWLLRRLRKPKHAARHAAPRNVRARGPHTGELRAPTRHPQEQPSRPAPQPPPAVPPRPAGPAERVVEPPPFLAQRQAPSAVRPDPASTGPAAESPDPSPKPTGGGAEPGDGVPGAPRVPQTGGWPPPRPQWRS